MIEQNKNRSQRGTTILEFTFVAVVFFMMLLAITSGGNLYFTHNALVEATRRGARFAATQAANGGAPGTMTGCPVTNSGPSLTAIRNFTVYGNVNGTGPPLISGLQPSNVNVEYCNFGVGTGAVSVFITGFNYNVVIPFASRQFQMPSKRTTVRGESAGALPSTCGT